MSNIKISDYSFNIDENYITSANLSNILSAQGYVPFSTISTYIENNCITSANLSSNLLMQGFVPFTTISTFVDNKLSGIEVTLDDILGEGE